METNVIGFSGKAGAGKDTAALYFINNGYVKFSFAGVLKRASMILFNLTEDHLSNEGKNIPLDKWNGRSPRELLQWLGTDVMRNQFDKDFFIIHAKHEITELLMHNKGVVITDVRFENEAQLIHSMGGMIFNITRNDRTKIQNESHESEKGLPEEWCVQVVNDQDITHLHQKIEKHNHDRRRPLED